MRLFYIASVMAAAACGAAAEDVAPIKPIERRLPPMGIELPPETAAKLAARLAIVQGQLDELPRDTPNRADAAVFVKAVRFAVELREFYDVKDVAKAERALDEAALRIEHLKAGKTPWLDVRGRTIVRGFVSAIDGSVQPYGVTIPAGLDLGQPAPLHVFLHGRNDKGTDVHFVDDLRGDRCVWKSDKAIVLQPFGRQCIGWKGPGEVDVFEAIDALGATWRIDDDRVALIGFSMGGAGAWHIGAHHADRFCVVAPGAGFADTARYLKLTPEQYPGEVEQKLWGVNDAPAYVRNLFNTRVVAYSGELDKQKQAADLMAEAFKAEGRELEHLIGPQAAHKYHPDSLKRLHEIVDEAVAKGRDTMPDEVHLQTRTPRYDRMYWISAPSLMKTWSDARVDAKWLGGGRAVITTRNVHSLAIIRNDLKSVVVDGQAFDPAPMVSKSAALFVLDAAGRWNLPPIDAPANDGVKNWRLTGPIDDAFMEPFLMVLPSGKSKSARIERWVEFESAHQVRRWRELVRGDVRVKLDRDVTADDIEQFNLVMWGDADSNSVIAKIADKLPLKPTDADQSQVTAMIYPNPLNAKRYVVLNSGPTFREADDRTNALQNPKLGDWAIVDVTVDPTDAAPGRVVESGFFDEEWKLPRRAE